MRPKIVQLFSNISFTQRVLWIIVSIFALVFGLSSFPNHYFFRTFSLDLGMFNQAMYDFAHLRSNHFTLDPTALEINYFGDHFSPITLLYAPFYYLFGSYTLLIIQIGAILFGGLGLYKYACKELASEKLALWLILHFYCIWGIYFALSFDFHNNVVGAMFVPWIVYYYEAKNTKMTLFFYFLLLIAKENMALWGACILLGLWIKNSGWQDIKRTLRYEIWIVMCSFLYFIVVVSILMPYIRQGQGLDQLDRYAHLGKTPFEILKTLLSSPKYIFSLFFETPFQSTNLPYVGIKSELHFVVLLSGGICFLYRPYYLMMLLPIYAQKFLSNNYFFWGISCQYSIEFAPIIVLAVLDVAKSITVEKHKNYFLAMFTLLTIAVTFSSMDRSVCWFNKTNVRFFQPAHFQTQLPISQIYSIIDTLPTDVPMSVSATLSPHLFQRQKLYNFPIVKESKYIFLLTKVDESMLFSKEDAIQSENYKKNPAFEIQYDSLNILLLKRKK